MLWYQYDIQSVAKSDPYLHNILENTIEYDPEKVDRKIIYEVFIPSSLDQVIKNSQRISI